MTPETTAENQQRPDLVPGVAPEVLRKYYEVGWERRWLAWLNDEGVPGDAGYKLRLKRTLDLVRPPRGGPFRMLDAGCGVGIYTVQCARRFPHATLFGVDMSGSQLEAAAALAKQFHVDTRVRFQVCDLTSRAFDQEVGGDWDVVLVAEVLEHLPDPLPVLKKIRDVTAPGGQVIISVPQLTPDEQEGAWVYHRVLTGKPDFDSVESMDRHALPPGEIFTYYHRHYRPDEMRRLLADAGLAVAGVGTVFWQRPRRCAAVWWRGMEYLVRRTAWTWLDHAMLGFTGSEWGHNLLWDCRVSQG